MACLERFKVENVQPAVLSVGGQHVHVAFEWASNSIKQMVGRVKKVSSHRVREQLPGKVWAIGCKIVPIKDSQHWSNVLNYIKGHNAWLWTCN